MIFKLHTRYNLYFFTFVSYGNEYYLDKIKSEDERIIVSMLNFIITCLKYLSLKVKPISNEVRLEL